MRIKFAPDAQEIHGKSNALYIPPPRLRDDGMFLMLATSACPADISS
jgi:hypothetical protein